MPNRLASKPQSVVQPMATRRRSKGHFIALAVALGLLAALAVVALWPRTPLDPQTLCPKDGDYPRTAVLIDATDSLGDSQVKTIREELDALRDRLAIHEWVGIFVLDEENLVLPVPAVALCYPGDESSANPLYENPRMVQSRFEREFRAPIDAAVEQLANLPPSPTSPILEMIRAVALDRNFDATVGRRLVIVSDLLQNVSSYSHYQSPADFERWRRTPYAREFLQLSMLGVKVDILYLKRVDLRTRQTRGHVAFWEDYFDAVGATVETLTPVL